MMKATILLNVLACISAQTVVDVAVNDDSFSTLVQALQTAGLVDTLSGDGPFTVFAPTNDAFGNLLTALDATAEELLARADLSSILTYHVVSGQVMSTDLSNGQLAATLQTDNIAVTIDANGVMVNDARVTTADVAATNGVVHVLNKVLMPGTDWLSGFNCELYQSACSGLSNYEAYSDCAGTVAANPNGMTCRTEHLYLALDGAAVHCPHAQPSATGPCVDETLTTPAPPTVDGCNSLQVATGVVMLALISVFGVM